MTTTTDLEMSSDEKKNGSGVEMLRKKLKERTANPYQYQIFNKDESPNWRHPKYSDFMAEASLNAYYRQCKQYESFDFSFDQPMIVGKVKHCTYSDLEGITIFKNPRVFRKTINGRLIPGTIVEGSKTRPATVKTWDFLLPIRYDAVECLDKFCDEVELFTDERVNMHPNLVKLYRYCCDTRLALVFDEGFTGVLLSDVILSDDFGWDKRMKVATQLADLFSCLHENSIALGCVTPACIMIDKEVNIKVFDFGYVTCSLMVDISIIDHPVAPEFVKVLVLYIGKKTAKADVYIFGILLLELMAKKKFSFIHGFPEVERSIKKEAKCGKRLLVHECFTEVDGQTALDLTLLVFRCTDFDQDKRPAMKDVLDALNAMGKRGEKRKRDENEAEQKKRYLTPLGLVTFEF